MDVDISFPTLVPYQDSILSVLNDRTIIPPATVLLVSNTYTFLFV